MAKPLDVWFGAMKAGALSQDDAGALRQAISQRAGQPVEVGVFDVRTQ